MNDYHIEYFASLREKRGRSKETLQSEAPTPQKLFDELEREASFGLERSALKVAVNDAFVPWEHQLEHGDRVVFIPPVGGG